MVFIYITGAPGSGKTTITTRLTELMDDVYDLDDPRLGGPFNIASNQPVTIPPAESRTEQWFNNHEWRINHQALVSLKNESEHGTVIICGVAQKDYEILPLFDMVLYLKLNDEIVVERLKARDHNDYGKNDFEIKDILKRKHVLDERYRYDAVVVDASKDIESVIAAIRHVITI